MDSFELNKIIGAILGTLLFVMGVGFLAEAIYHPVTGNGPGYALPAPEEGGGEGGGGGEVVQAISIGTLLASADPVLGADQAKKCQACHDLTEANTNKSGPGLYDIVERVIGSHPGFGYSAVMADHQAKGDVWTYENLDHFLLAPKGFAPGTKMTFAGVKNDQERANIIAFLSTLSASPKPFPPADAPAGAETATDEQTVDGTVSTAPEAAAETPATTEEPSAEPAPAASEAPAASSEAPVSAEASSAAQ